MRFTSLVLPSAALLVAAATALPALADISAAAAAFADAAPVATPSARLRGGDFWVAGIETAAGLDPITPTALIAGLTFSGNADFSGPMTRRVAGVPEPETYALVIAGLAALGVLRRSRPRAR